MRSCRHVIPLSKIRPVGKHEHDITGLEVQFDLSTRCMKRRPALVSGCSLSSVNTDIESNCFGRWSRQERTQSCKWRRYLNGF
jgi:hypothetical protein